MIADFSVNPLTQMPFLPYLLTALVVFSSLVRADEPPLRVAVTPDSLRFTWPPGAGMTEIRELPLHTSAAGDGRVLWSGEGAEATVPRFDGKRDRLFAKFEPRAGGKALGSPQHVTDFSALPQRKNSLGSLANKKGIACRIVILTVFEDEAKISQAISAGASGYLLKTATPDEIAEAILEASHGGSPMSPHVAASVVKLLARLTKPVTSAIALSPRELELLRCMVEGLTAKEIAARLAISIHTADTHTRNLYSKLSVRSRAAAVARAMREKLV